MDELNTVSWLVGAELSIVKLFPLVGIDTILFPARSVPADKVTCCTPFPSGII